MTPLEHVDIYLPDAQGILGQLAEDPEQEGRDHLVQVAIAHALTSIATNLAKLDGATEAPEISSAPDSLEEIRLDVAHVRGRLEEAHHRVHLGQRRDLALDAFAAVTTLSASIERLCAALGDRRNGPS